MRWLLLLIPSLLVEGFCRITNWFVCLFVRYEIRTDRVKRMGNKQITMRREYLIKPFMLWQTHDNAVDEGWYGAYDFMTNKTQADYNNSWWLRYRCRVWWLNRNTAYGFMYKYFGADGAEVLSYKDFGDKSKYKWMRYTRFTNAWQLEVQYPIGRKYISINIGWKAHRGFNRLMYANRIIGLRTIKDK